ncbi:MAG: hypothetical protein RLO52_20925 [Sandaracinaceae bacterium]
MTTDLCAEPPLELPSRDRLLSAARRLGWLGLASFGATVAALFGLVCSVVFAVASLFVGALVLAVVAACAVGVAVLCVFAAVLLVAAAALALVLAAVAGGFGVAFAAIGYALRGGLAIFRRFGETRARRTVARQLV